MTQSQQNVLTGICIILLGLAIIMIGFSNIKQQNQLDSHTSTIDNMLQTLGQHEYKFTQETKNE